MEGAYEVTQRRTRERRNENVNGVPIKFDRWLATAVTVVIDSGNSSGTVNFYRCGSDRSSLGVCHTGKLPVI